MNMTRHRKYLTLLSAACLPSLAALAETPVTVTLLDIESGATSPAGNYRWLNIADQAFADSYRESYDYTQADVTIDLFTDAGLLHGMLTASGLKPDFTYQLKLLGVPDLDVDANERIGATGRWWQEIWNGTAWASGQNLNDKGDGSSPNPNDLTYLARRDILDSTSPSGRHYRYTGYVVFDYFTTDSFGNAAMSFVANDSYHVLWKTSQEEHTALDGPIKATTVDVELPDPVNAYDVDYPEVTEQVFGEWERLPIGGVTLSPGTYQGELILTEESFHGSGLAGGWAAAMGAPVVFRILDDPFVTVNDGRFMLAGRPHYFAGVNFWQAMNLVVDGSTGDRVRLGEELDTLAQLGITNLRIMAASEGPNTEPYRMVPALMTAPGGYDADVLDALDYLLAQIELRGMHAVMVLSNFWFWSGGMAQYVSWYEDTPIPYPPTHGWTAFIDYSAKFYDCAQCQTWYRDHIATIIERTNPYIGMQYRDNPAVFSWELANEPRGFPMQWIDDTAAYIKSLDPNHLVTTGSEGSMGGEFVATHDGSAVDYATIHIWPQNWGWYSPEDPGTYAGAEQYARDYFQAHELQALELGKPLVLEEFGLARDWEPSHDIFNPDSPTTLRDLFFAALFEEVYSSALAGGPAAGDNIWAWSGQGRPGDLWIGDPPHEIPGWYSVYDTDSSTLEALSSHAVELNAICLTDDDCDDGDPCTGVETCVVGACQSGTPIDCGTQYCHPVEGSCVECYTDVHCDDGVDCTIDSCDAREGCTNIDGCPTWEICDPATGLCVEQPGDPPSVVSVGSRYLAITPPPGVASVALCIDNDNMSCMPKYIDAEGFLADTPFFQSSTAWGIVYAGDRQLTPSTTYSVRADVRLPTEPEHLSDPVSATTWAWGDTNSDGGVGLFDIVCVLDGFQDIYTSCSLQGVDLQGRTPNRDVDLFDIAAVLDGFQMLSYPDSDPCLGTASMVVAPEEVGSAVIRLVPSPRIASPGDVVVVEVYGAGFVDLRGYQLGLDVTGAASGEVSLEDVRIEEERGDYVFNSLPSVAVAGPSSGRLASAVVSGGVSTRGHAYLGTFVFRVLKSARGDFRVGLRLSSDAILLDSMTAPLVSEGGAGVSFRVMPRRSVRRASGL